MLTRKSFPLAWALGAGFLLATLLTAVPAAADGGSYGYFRVIEGTATLIPADSGERAGAQVNQPFLPGDRVRVPSGSRVELVLPDRNVLRLDGGSEVAFDQLAGLEDGNDTATRLRLNVGNAQLVVDQDALGDELPRIDTPNASVYIQAPGAYRLTTDQGEYTQVVVRKGTAEVATEGGTATVHAGEEATVEGAQQPQAEVREATAVDDLERWGRQLSDQMASDSPYVDEGLAYQAAPLTQYGSWIVYEDRSYWRPNVEAGWQPYLHGHWIYTPSGLTWVADEPWGWVPYHYGTWDYVPGYGWVWEPGDVYAPAWVYWYWGPEEIGWCPIGYYTHFYGRHFNDPGFRFGVYGWAGGDWDFFGRWNFVPVHNFDDRHLDHFARPAMQLRDEVRMMPLPRGIITTDSRPLTPGHLKEPRVVIDTLSRGAKGGTLTDVTTFVARRPDLPPQVLHTVVVDTPTKGNLTGTPLRPATLGTRPTGGHLRTAGGTPATPIAPTAPGKGGATGTPPARPGHVRGAWADRPPASHPAGQPTGSQGGQGAKPAEHGPVPVDRGTRDRKPAAPVSGQGDRPQPVHRWDRPPVTPPSGRIKPRDDGRPRDQGKPPDSARPQGRPQGKPPESAKPSGGSKPPESSKPASKPPESAKPSGGSKPPDSAKPPEHAKPADDSRPKDRPSPPPAASQNRWVTRGDSYRTPNPAMPATAPMGLTGPAASRATVYRAPDVARSQPVYRPPQAAAPAPAPTRTAAPPPPPAPARPRPDRPPNHG